MSSSHTELDIWNKAEKITKKRKNAHEVWTDLKSWAIKEKDPVAMKAAIFEFLAVYGTNPEAAALLPEIFRDAAHLSSSLPEEEKKVLVELADRASLAFRLSYNKEISLDPKKLTFNVPVSKNRPALALNFHPDSKLGILTPLKPSTDAKGLIEARDTMLKVNEMVLSINMPSKMPSNKQKNEKLMAFGAASSDRGEELIQALVEKMKAQASEGAYRHPVQRKSAKKKTVKKAAPKKKTKKKQAPKKKKAKPRKKPAKKAVKKVKKVTKKRAAKKRTKKKPTKKKAVKRVKKATRKAKKTTRRKTTKKKPKKKKKKR